MNLVIDTSVIIAALTSEPERRALVRLTRGADLLAPASVHWEVGNALAAMFKRGRIDAKQISRVLRAYERIPVRYVDLDLPDALDLAVQHGIYAYDAYVIACARNQGCSIVSLDQALLRVAKAAGVRVLEVEE
jgi:predicted nucleic acid-binding protein